MLCRSCGHCSREARTRDDIHLPLLLWWALEAKVATDPEAVLALFQDRAIWDLPIVRATIAERLMRRFAAAGTQAGPDELRRLLAMAPGPDHIKRLMAGFEAAVAGRALTGLPAELAEALAKYSGQSVTLGLRQGKPEALSEALHVLADDRADRAKQLQLLQILGEVRRPACVPVVLRLACQSPDNALRSAAFCTLAGYDDPAIADEVIKAYANMSDDVRASAQSLLVTRRGLGGPVPRGDRRPDDRSPHRSPRGRREAVAAGRLASHAPWQPSCSDRSSRPPRPSFTRQIDRLAAVIRAGSGVPKPGKQIFDQQCTRCHTLFGKGGKVGPDLTTYRRDDLETMLLNIVNPSADIREGYATHIVSHDRRPRALRRRGRAGQERRGLARQRRQGHSPRPRRHRRDAHQPQLDHARRPAQGLERPAGARPVRLPAEYPAIDRLRHQNVGQAFLPDAFVLRLTQGRKTTNERDDLRDSLGVGLIPRGLGAIARWKRSSNFRSFGSRRNRDGPR